MILTMKNDDKDKYDDYYYEKEKDDDEFDKHDNDG